MKDKIVFATVATNNEYYYNCGKNLLRNFEGVKDIEIYVYTDDESEFREFKGIKFIKHAHSGSFKFHDKFVFINEVRKLGYNKICYVDADMYLIDKQFIENIKSHDFNAGLSYTRFTSLHFRALLETNPKLQSFRSEIDTNGIYYKNAITPWEDLLFFNFENLPEEKIELLFKNYSDYRILREKSAGKSGDDLRGEGAVFGLAAANTEFPIIASIFLYNQLQYFRDNHFPNYEDIESLSTEVDFIFVVKETGEEYIKMLDITVNFYRQHFKKTNFIVIEVNEESTVKDIVGDTYNDSYILIDPNTPNVEYEAIKQAAKLSKNNVFVLIENGSILLDCRNIQNSMELVLREQFDYIIPFNNRYTLPYFKINPNNYSTMFIVNKTKFLELFNEIGPWTSDNDRHDKLIDNGFNFKMTPNDLIDLDNNNPLIRGKLI